MEHVIAQPTKQQWRRYFKRMPVERVNFSLRVYQSPGSKVLLHRKVKDQVEVNR